jgi:hypothetical protein
MWKLKPDDRLDHWKQFRRRISQLSIQQAIDECRDFWSRAPFTPYYLEYDQPETWPTPWQLIYENCYCDLAKALGIVYTIHLSDHTVDLGLRVYQDPTNKMMYNLVWIEQGKYVLNFDSEDVVNRNTVPQELKLLCEYTSAELGLDRY